MTATPPSLVATLARLARGPDADAWAALVDTVGPELARACAAVAGGDLGQDALHETLLRLRDRAGRFVPPGDGDADRAARGWARRVAVTTALELLRARRRQRDRAARGPVPRVSDDPAELSARRERDALVRRELAALPSDQREAVTLHYLLGTPLAEIAAAEGIGVEAAKKRAQRGAERLRARLVRVGVALSLPAALTELRAEEAPFDHALAFEALAKPAAPVFGALKGLVVISIIALPVVVAGMIAAQSGRDDLHAGDHRPAADAATTLTASDGVPMTGLDLYSWRDDNRWRYALMEGANRTKRADEIRRAAVDEAAVEQRLATLSKGAEVAWNVVVTTDRGLPFALPDQVTRDRVRGACDRAGVRLSIDEKDRAASTAVADAQAAAAVAPAYPELSFDFDDIPLRDAARMITSLSGRKIRVADGVPDAGVTLHVDNMRLDNVLTFVARVTDTAWSVAADGAIVIGPPKSGG